MKTISLYTGCGGLDVGLEIAGFTPACCVEIDPECRATLKWNRPSWNVLNEGDIFSYHPKDILAHTRLKQGEASLLIAGPPCQPFSKAGFWHLGKTLRLRDPRSKTFQAFVEIAREALPHLVLLENVDGFLRQKGIEEVSYLESEFLKINRSKKTNYQLQFIQINAADYGVPQKRRRVFIVAHRDGLELKLPPATHGPYAKDGIQPWRTSWDAIGNLENQNGDLELKIRGKWAHLAPSIPEGKNYLWHTNKGNGKALFGWRTRYWSFLLKLAKNRPSWTITAHPGPATGPIHWKNRLLSVEEVSRLQTFPPNYKIVGTRMSALSQLGNAVPAALGELLGREIANQFFGFNFQSNLSLIPKVRSNCPPPERVRPVPKIYYDQIGSHRAHPGTGKGPGAKKRSRKK